jgi:uncharacterized FlgJ-related protein
MLIATLGLFLVGKKVFPTQLLKLKEALIPPQRNSLSRVKQAIRNKSLSDNSAALIFGQFYHETGGGSSSLFEKNKNLFGMKRPTKRETTSIGGDVYNYAIYNSIEDSIEDLFLWFDYANLNPNDYSSAEGYVNALKAKNYFQDNESTYLTGVKYGLAKYFQT